MPKSAKKKSKSTDELRQKLKLKNFQVKNQFREKYPEAHRNLVEKEVDLGKIRQHSAKIVGAGALAGSIALGPQIDLDKTLPPPNEVIERFAPLPLESKDPVVGKKKNSEMLTEILGEFLPKTTRPLSRNEEKLLERVFSEVIGIEARASLEGEHLNTTYGRIGAEQHLKRYPGDSLANHAPTPEDYGGDNPQEILKEGIAPGLGAWGYFAYSKGDFTPDLEETERWYGVVQTLYLPDWNSRQPYLRDWYKHRKILMVNTLNGKAVVAAIADSGPAAWTGKHYGGSPEVMDYLGGPRYKKGPVIVFFVDDPENKVPLGPVEYN